MNAAPQPPQPPKHHNAAAKAVQQLNTALEYSLLRRPEVRHEQSDHDARYFGKPLAGWRLRVYTIIFEADTPVGRMFDIGLIIMVLLSIVAVITDSIPFFHRHFGTPLVGLEWFFTIAFTVEYVLRLLCVRQPMRYVLSFNGLVDLFSILPSYLMLAFPSAAYLMSIRILRLLRIFRIFKLVRYVEAYQSLGRALLQSRFKITVFMSVAMMMVLIIGTLMHIVEGADSGFTSIPASMYWAITTITTVGYGDIAPKTELGRLIASFTMFIGWSIIAVPTAIVTAEISGLKPARPSDITTRTCHHCLTEGHLRRAKFCFNCGEALPQYLKTNAQLDKAVAKSVAEQEAQEAKEAEAAQARQAEQTAQPAKHGRPSARG